MVGKWFFEMWFTTIGGGDGDSLGIFGPWETEKEAQAELRRASQLACETVQEKIEGKPSGQYVDMKTNTVRRWDRSDEH